MEYIEPLTNKINVIIGIFTAVFAYIWGDNWIFFFAFLLMNIGDFVTRWIAAYVTGTESSEKGWKGILKKLGYWIMIALGFGMSVIFVEIGNVFGFDFGITVLLGWFVLTSLIVNEARSILENLVDAGYHPPLILIKGLETADTVLDKLENGVVKYKDKEKEE